MRSIALPVITFITVIAIAACAAFYSIYGLVLIFSGAVLAVAIMAGALEAGKLVITSIVFHYWKQMPILLTMYSIVAIIGLMLITSGGIYGFLSSAYQQSQIPLQQLTTRLELIEDEYQQTVSRLDQMDSQIAAIGANYITRRMEEVEQQRPERETLIARRDQLSEQRLDLRSRQLDVEAHIGPIIKIAEAFNLERDQAVHYLILLFIFVFDPLAIALTLCLNVVVRSNKQAKLEQMIEQGEPTDGDDDPSGGSSKPQNISSELATEIDTSPASIDVSVQDQLHASDERPHKQLLVEENQPYHQPDYGASVKSQIASIDDSEQLYPQSDDMVDIERQTLESTTEPKTEPMSNQSSLFEIVDDLRGELNYLKNTFRNTPSDGSTLRQRLIDDIRFTDR